MIVEEEVSYNESSYIYLCTNEIIPMPICRIISDYMCSTKKLIVYSNDYTNNGKCYFWKGDYTKGQYYDGHYKMTLTPKGGFIPLSLCGDQMKYGSMSMIERKLKIEFEIHRQDLKIMMENKQYDSDMYKCITITRIEHLAYSILCNIFSHSSNFENIIREVVRPDHGLLINLEKSIYGEDMTVFIYCLEYVHHELKLVAELIKKYLLR